MSVRLDSKKIISYIIKASVVQQILEHLNLREERLSLSPQALPLNLVSQAPKFSGKTKNTKKDFGSAFFLLKLKQA
jgi:hypothetical protein